MVSAGIKAEPFARLAHVTAIVETPTHVALSADRRDQLLAWAQKADAWIVEDDCNADFRYDGKRRRRFKASIAAIG